jgi:hypothetical protein
MAPGYGHSSPRILLCFGKLGCSADQGPSRVRAQGAVQGGRAVREGERIPRARSLPEIPVQLHIPQTSGGGDGIRPGPQSEAGGVERLLHKRSRLSLRQAQEDQEHPVLLGDDQDQSRGAERRRLAMMIIMTLGWMTIQGWATLTQEDIFIASLSNQIISYLIGPPPQRLRIAYVPPVMEDTTQQPTLPTGSPRVDPPIPLTTQEMPLPISTGLSQFRMYSILRASLTRLLAWVRRLFSSGGIEE